MTLAAHQLDFLVIGAMKSGTTTFWKGLDSHPEVVTPADKERGFFDSDARYERGLAAYVETVFAGAGPDQRVGTVTPSYMTARRHEVVSDRIAATSPDVKLIALLRDPIDRAVSQYRQAVRVGTALGPSLDAHVRAAETGKGSVPDVVANGDYGRILARYREHFAAEQLLVLYTEDLERDPAAVLRRAFAFLGVDATHRVPELPSLNVGGTRMRVAPDRLDEIVDWLEREVLPAVARPVETRRAFAWWLKYHWNTEPDHEAMTVGIELRAQLLRRYVADADALIAAAGHEPPWLEAYRRELASSVSA